MKYQLLGRSGLRVSELCLGTMTFGAGQSWGASKDESLKILNAFYEAGGNFINTANAYSDGLSESYIGQFISSDRDRFVIATKYSLSTCPNDVNACGSHRKNLARALNASLKRLNTDYIDMYWVHAWDHLTPVEEVMRALDDSVRDGKILYVGVSDTPAWVASQANTLASLRGWTPFVGLQIQYSLIERTSERELIPMARAFDIGVTAWGALGGGLLSGKYIGDEAGSQPGRLAAADPSLNERNLRIAKAVKSVGHEIGRTPSQVALNWVRQQSSAMIPILGARTESQLRENAGALDFTLSEEHKDMLDTLSRIDLGFPHELLDSERFKSRFFGETLPWILDSKS